MGSTEFESGSSYVKHTTEMYYFVVKWNNKRALVNKFTDLVILDQNKTIFEFAGSIPTIQFLNSLVAYPQYLQTPHI